MKQLVKTYVFSATAKTITLTDFTTVALERLQLVVDSTTNTILYNFVDPSLASATASSNVFTLSTVGSASSADRLMVVYDAASGDPVYDTPRALVTNFPTTQAVNGSVVVSNLPSTQPVSATSLPLPTGAAVESGGNLAAVATNTSRIPALGASPTLSSMPVNIANDQIVRTQNAFTEQAGLSAGVLNADLVPSTEVSAYKWLSLQVSGTFVGILTFQFSNDNTNWSAASLQNSSQSANTNGNTTSSTGIFFGPTQGRFLRVRMTSYNSGTATGTLELYTAPGVLTTMGVAASQAFTWNVGSNAATGAVVPANAFYIAGVNGGNLTGVQVIGGSGDGVSNSLNLLGVSAFETNFNGSTWDRRYNNTSSVVRAAGQTATTTTALTVYNAQRLVVLLNITAGTGSVTLTINGVSTSGYTYPLLNGSAISGTGVTPHRVGIGFTPSPNATVNDAVPRNVSVVATVTGTVTYGLDAVMTV